MSNQLKISFAVDEKQARKVKVLCKLLKTKTSKLMRRLIDENIPSIDAASPFWREVDSSKLFDAEVPFDSIIPFIGTILGMNVTGKFTIGDTSIKPDADGIKATLNVLKKLEAIYEKDLSDRANQQVVTENDSQERRGTPADLPKDLPC